jgi:hypothetical protein
VKGAICDSFGGHSPRTQFVSAGNNVLIPVAPLPAKVTLPQLFYDTCSLPCSLDWHLRLFCLHHFFPDVGAGGVADFFLAFFFVEHHGGLEAAATPFT